MYNVGKSVIIDLIIKAYCEINNFDYENLSSNGYSEMYDMCYELDDNILITRLGELYEILQK
ncbi:MAG: hypothetical protein ACM67R_06515 [Clostridiales bacterium]